MNKVVILRDGQPYQQLPLEPYMGIGRRQSHAIQIEDHRLSRNHAEIYREGNDFFVKDIGSTNGTFLNGEKLVPEQPRKLVDQDFLTLGAFELRFHLTGAPAAPAPSQGGLVVPPTHYQGPPPSSPVMEHLLSARNAIPVWSKGEIEVKVADIVDETHDVQTYRLVGVEPLLFSYRPGQFVTLILNIDGKDVKRSYSIASTPSRPHTLELTIKRVPGGLVSNWLADHLKLGDTVRIKGPSGKFSCFEYPSHKMLFIAAGSGITPVMSMTRWIIDTTADIDVKFLLSSRTMRDIIYHQEFEYLSARHSGFQCAVTLTSPICNEAWVGLMGRVNQDMLRMVCSDLRDRHVFLCGPEPFANTVKGLLRDMEFPMANYHTESFGGKRVAKGVSVAPRDVERKTTLRRGPAASVSEPAAPIPAAREAEAPAAQFEVQFARSGVAVQTCGEASLLDLAEANGIEIDYACRTGSCGECKVLCKSGRCEMEEEEGLEEGEKEQGFVLTCVACPKSNIVLDV